MTKSCKKCGQIVLEDGIDYGCLCLLKKAKYRNQCQETDDGYFHSKGEYHRWIELKTLARGGAITDLKRQVKIPLHAKGGTLIGHYVADYRYLENGVPVVEDFKGADSIQLSKWKLKHFEAEYGYKVRITKRGGKCQKRKT